MREATENKTPDRTSKGRGQFRRGPSGGPVQGGKSTEQLHEALPPREDALMEVPFLTVLVNLNAVCLRPTE